MMTIVNTHFQVDAHATIDSTSVCSPCCSLLPCLLGVVVAMIPYILCYLSPNCRYYCLRF